VKTGERKNENLILGKGACHILRPAFPKQIQRLGPGEELVSCDPGREFLAAEPNIIHWA
jgi:hypothetical protein